MPDDVTLKERVDFALEAWKTVVEVQEHFNTIEMQIRNLAVTVLTATVAAGGVVYSQGQQAIASAVESGNPIPDLNTIHVAALRFSAADMIIFGGLLAWGGFYFMDRWWYHKLLKAAVDKGSSIERFVAETPYGDLMGLAGTISAASPVKLLCLKIGSNQKIDIFYGVVATVLVLIIWLVF